MARNNNPNEVGLSVAVEKGGYVSIGKDIRVYIQKNGNSAGCKRFSILIRAPRDIPISTYDGKGKLVRGPKEDYNDAKGNH